MLPYQRLAFLAITQAALVYSPSLSWEKQPTLLAVFGPLSLRALVRLPAFSTRTTLQTALSLTHPGQPL